MNNDLVNKRGFAPIFIICILLVLFIVGLTIFRKRDVSKTVIDQSSPSSIDVSSTQREPVSSEVTTLTCDNLHATFQVPSNFEKYEEVNAQGETVCLLSDKIQDGHISPTHIYIAAFATQNTSSAMGMTSRKAAMADTQKYGGMTDLPEAVVKKGTFATYHVIAPDALKNTALWYIDSISNDDTDTYYTITLSVPKSLQNTVDATTLMKSYVLDGSF